MQKSRWPVICSQIHDGECSHCSTRNDYSTHNHCSTAVSICMLTAMAASHAKKRTACLLPVHDLRRAAVAARMHAATAATQQCTQCASLHVPQSQVFHGIHTGHPSYSNLIFKVREWPNCDGATSGKHFMLIARACCSIATRGFACKQMWSCSRVAPLSCCQG